MVLGFFIFPQDHSHDILLDGWARLPQSGVTLGIPPKSSE